MDIEVLVYEGRHGQFRIMRKSPETWDLLIGELEVDDGGTIAEAVAKGFWVDGGTYEDGHVYVDDGGRIFTAIMEMDI